MIKFKALMNAIHQSIHSAAQAVEAEGVKHIETFFDAIKNDDIKQDDDNTAPETRITHRPKMVAMAFPSRTDKGIESVMVNVPLITLSPVSSPRIQEVKFKAELDVSTNEDNELMVAFANSNKRGLLSHCDHRVTNTSIEITLKGNEPPEGLQLVIEGYEKALRSQIPG
jgi:hypothetical protein